VAPDRLHAGAHPDTPSLDYRDIGPSFPPTHPLAVGPTVAPERTVDGFVREYLRELNFGQGAALSRSTANHQYLALARTVRHYLMASWLETAQRRREHPTKMVGYLSAEYLLGRQLGNALMATDLREIVEEGLRACGLDIRKLRVQEVEPGLGNGGLGRLAACFIDSLATMDVSCIGYGIRYEYGIFRQTFVDGRQVEIPDTWLSLGAPWEFPNPERAVRVDFGGQVEPVLDETGTPVVDPSGVARRRWVPAWNVLGIPYNYMVPGYRNGVVNTLRLWSAEATRAFDLAIFNSGDYAQAVRAQTFAENISKVLYPEDSTPQGRELRLQQQYFFVACSLRDYLDGTLPQGFDLHQLPDQIVFQLNDTHPVIAVPELMRLLVDEKGLVWDEAWSITQRCFAYTCHTLLPEALEVWPTDLLGRLLPRHLEIIYRINEGFLATVRAAYPGDELRARRMSIVSDYPQAVRMAHLAIVGSFAVNGVAALHSDLLKSELLRDFCDLWPEKFSNKTNGVTPRRFVLLSNPTMSQLIDDTIGKGWVTDMARLRELEPHADDPAFRKVWRNIKRSNKESLVREIKRVAYADVDPASMFDIQVKRIHEYKRQHLNLLHVVSLYKRLKDNPNLDVAPRTVIFGGKAAPGYAMAKLMIRR
jgi:starch phosphorylase